MRYHTLLVDEYHDGVIESLIIGKIELPMSCRQAALKKINMELLLQLA